MSSRTSSEDPQSDDPLADDRENYKRWPWASFLVIGLSVGIIFFLASSPRQIKEATGGTLALQIFFLIFAIILFFPSIVVTLILFCYCLLKANGCKPPKCVRRFFRRIYKPQKSSIHKPPSSHTSSSLSVPGPENNGGSRSGSPFPVHTPKIRPKTTALPPEDAEPVWTTHKQRSQPGYSYPSDNTMMPKEHFYGEHSNHHKWTGPTVNQTTVMVHQPRTKSPPTITIERTDSESSSSSEDSVRERPVDVPMVTVEAQPIIIKIKDDMLTSDKELSSIRTDPRGMEPNNNTLRVQAPATKAKNKNRSLPEKPSLKKLREKGKEKNMSSNKSHDEKDGLELTNDSRKLVQSLSSGSSDEAHDYNRNHVLVESIPMKNLKKNEKKEEASNKKGKNLLGTLQEQAAGHSFSDKQGLLAADTTTRKSARQRWGLLKAAAHLKVFVSPDNDMQNPRKGQMWKDSHGNIVLM